MQFRLHPEHAKAIMRKGRELVSALAPSARSQSSDPDTFSPDIFVAGHISDHDIVGEITTHLIDPVTGRKTANYFFHNGSWIGLEGPAYRELLLLAERVRSRPPFRDTVSIAYLADRGFEWIKGAYLKEASCTLPEYIEAECAKAVKLHTVWIPVAFLHVEHEFRLGRTMLKTITRDMLRLWEDTAIKAHLEHKEELELYFQKQRKNLQGLAACVMDVVSEPRHAVDTVFREAERSLAVLRAHSAANLVAKAVSHCVPLGHEHRISQCSLDLSGGSVPDIKEELVEQGEVPWVLDRNTLDELRQLGIDRWSKLLAASKLTSFEESAHAALIYYSRAALCRSPADKLVYILVALESILLRNDTEAIQQNVGERLAFCVGRNADERLEITAIVRKIYRMRSRFLHHGRWAAESKALARFLEVAWIFFMSLAKILDRYDSEEKFLQALERRKFQ